MAGDIVYFVMPVRDADKGKAFFGELFGWSFAEGRVPGGFQVEGSNPPGGMFAGGEETKPSVWFSVDDIEAARAKILDLGGEADEAEEIPSGWMASCRDDQGSEFNIWAPKS